MIVPPKGWRAELVDEKLKLISPGGPATGAISYEERLRPIRSVRELVEASPPPSGFTVTRTNPIRELVTREGEAGALVDVEGTLGDTPALLAFGFVFLDDFYSCLRGFVLVPGEFERFLATMAELITCDAHLLGRVRRRRFRHAAPAGWSERRRLFESRFFAPGDPSVISVGPALPKLPGLGDAILAAVVGDADPLEAVRAPRRAVSTRAGLRGQRWHLRLHATEVHLVILEDECFLYCVRLDSTPDAPSAERAFDELVASIAPVPAPAAFRPETLGALGCWVD